ncbi:MAG: glycine--tRNA ligase subunit beta [Casimicrobiaceae bacterium]
MSTATLVVELLAEELPPKALPRLGEAFSEGVGAGLRDRDFLSKDSTVTPYATPRRLAVAITQVRAVAPDAEVSVKLMPAKVARDAAGQVSEALKKKLAGLGRPHLATASLDANDGPDRIYVAADGKAEYVYLRSLAKGQSLTLGLQAALDDALAHLPIPKMMSYSHGGYYNDVKFIRPVHAIVALHGAAVVPVRALNLSAGRTTGGHRFLSRGVIEIATAETYAPALAQAKVIASFAARRAAIVKGLHELANGLSILMPDTLLDEVTALVEWPAVYAGTFDPAFLAVPQECLILTMQLNQKYFALAGKSGQLTNQFLLVSNIETPNPAAIISGNERVLRARLADAKFFFDQDRREPLETRVDKLSRVVYQNKLGTQGARVGRLCGLAAKIAWHIGADAAHAERAARLAKADLTTDMVGEFPELQGTMGRYYAQHDGEPAAVADAIAQHYWPRFAGDALPEGPVAQAVALADKLEALAGMFGIGQVPTGDKDPFGLRRAALGVIRILVERKRRVSLSDLIDLAYCAFAAVPAVALTREPLLDFIYDRLRGYLREQGYTANQVAAVVDSRPDFIDDLPLRLAAVVAFAGLPEAAALSTANKRIVNILRKSGVDTARAVDRARLAEGAERDLFMAFQKLSPQVAACYDNGDFHGALRALATAKPIVDRYFDSVMVMTDDPALRANRLALLRDIAGTMNRVADISKLAQ